MCHKVRRDTVIVITITCNPVVILLSILSVFLIRCHIQFFSSRSELTSKACNFFPIKTAVALGLGHANEVLCGLY